MMKKILYSALTLILGLVLSSSGCTHDTIDPALFDEGVEINGVTWATRNVGEFGKFATNPQDPGMFYQWNRKTAYSATDPLTPAWNTAAISSTWDSSNDPCPDGWRVPTSTEMGSLMYDDANVDYAWVAGGGRFTNKATPANTIFLPAAGGRYDTDGASFEEGSGGYYWTNTDYDGSHAFNYLVWSTGKGASCAFYRLGHSIRCVKGAK